jgi:hypothetical protein
MVDIWKNVIPKTRRKCPKILSQTDFRIRCESQYVRSEFLVTIF